jgi:ABC-type transport system involved in cytochrome c biogenesis permease subunit
VPEKKRDLAQQKILEASTKVSRVMTLRQAFNIPNIGERGELLFTNQADFEKIIAQLRNVAPKAVPPATPDDQWLTVYESMYNAFRQLATTGRADAADERGTRELLQMLAAYREGESVQFNARLADYRNLINQTAAAEAESEAALAAAGEPNHRKPAERLVLDRIAFESFFNHFSPFIICLVFYVAAFVLAALSWVGWPRVLNRAANWLLWFTFGLHTFGLICRIYISGRPPVTNLYSSALFIAWAGVLFFLLLEIIYKVGLGNLLAAVLGVPTMFIAYYLTFEHDGDTLGVMQAVLDTNFWLGTHVVCIALGYQATLAAGAAGLLTLLLGSIGGVLDENLRRQLTRMTYGALCFAIFFSFIGTILGGLWADDSWGRFWGWDPKENGALMIVIWNAIVLHARWGKMVGERGLAALAVLGNIVVAWSWWGVNQLSIGLHNYGWTEGLTFWLVLFDALMLAVVATAYLMPLVKSAAPQPPAAAA